MKRYLAVLLILVCLLGAVGCENGQDENGQTYFTAEVIEAGAHMLLVMVTSSENSGISIGEQAFVPTEVVSGDGCPDVAAGETVRVVFDGKIMETYPLQIGTVFAIYKMDASGKILAD